MSESVRLMSIEFLQKKIDPFKIEIDSNGQLTAYKSINFEERQTTKLLSRVKLDCKRCEI